MDRKTGEKAKRWLMLCKKDVLQKDSYTEKHAVSFGRTL
jgi:hypothetical protein